MVDLVEESVAVAEDSVEVIVVVDLVTVIVVDLVMVDHAEENVVKDLVMVDSVVLVMVDHAEENVVKDLVMVDSVVLVMEVLVEENVVKEVIVTVQTENNQFSNKEGSKLLVLSDLNKFKTRIEFSILVFLYIILHLFYKFI